MSLRSATLQLAASSSPPDDYRGTAPKVITQQRFPALLSPFPPLFLLRFISFNSKAPAATPALRPRQLTAREPCLTWEDWDDPSLKDFLLEEVIAALLQLALVPFEITSSSNRFVIVAAASSTHPHFCILRQRLQARTFSNPAERRQQVVEWDERVALSHLARDWKVPFLSKASARTHGHSVTSSLSSSSLLLLAGVYKLVQAFELQMQNCTPFWRIEL